MLHIKENSHNNPCLFKGNFKSPKSLEQCTLISKRPAQLKKQSTGWGGPQNGKPSLPAMSLTETQYPECVKNSKELIIIKITLIIKNNKLMTHSKNGFGTWAEISQKKKKNV